jgi:hypothetical protein
MSETIGEWWSRAGRNAAYGPWSPGLPLAERNCQLRCMAGLARVYLGPNHVLPGLLRLAETDDVAFVRAGLLVETLPSRTRRMMLGTFSAVTWPRQPRRPSPPRRPYRDDIELEQVSKFSDLPESAL